MILYCVIVLTGAAQPSDVVTASVLAPRYPATLTQKTGAL